MRLKKNSLDALLAQAAEKYAKAGPGEALADYQALVEAFPASGAAWFGLACAEHAVGEAGAAERAYRQAIAAGGTSTASAWFNLGNLLRDDGRLKGAREAYEQAQVLNGAHAASRFALAQLDLLQGDWRSGWAGYEYRQTMPGQPAADRARLTRFNAQAPAWDGRSVVGGLRLLVYSEQGAGDTLQFLRFVPRLAERFAVILAVPASVLPLLRGNPRFAGITLLDLADHLPTFDAHVSLMSLPYRLGLATESDLASPPYLAAPAAAVQRWAAALADARGLKVGIAWAGNPQHGNDARRSLPLANLSRLFNRGDVTWVSLQKTLRPGDEKALQKLPGLRRYGEQLDDFGDTAGLLANLDLVISVDTSVSHLAGALGRPLWVLLPKTPDWRWQLGREDSPWYASARLFRQKTAGSWRSVMNAVVTGLDALVPAGRQLQALPGKPSGEPRGHDTLAAAVQRVDFSAVDGLLGVGKIDEADARCAALAGQLSSDDRGGRGLLDFKRGCIALFRKDWAMAEALLRSVLLAHPAFAEAHCNLGMALARQGQDVLAEQSLRQAIALRGNYLDAWRNLAALLRRIGRPDEAADCYRRTLELAPDDIAALKGLAELARVAARHAEAEGYLGRVLALRPNDADAALNYGRILRDSGQARAAEACWRELLARDPAYFLARINLAMLLLAEGRWAEGWAQYEARWQGAFMPLQNRQRREELLARAPAWQGEPLAGKRLLVYPEQGAGDTFQFLRFVPALRKLGAEILLGATPNSRSLIEASGLCGAHRIAEGKDIAHDYHVPLLSLPHRLGLVDEQALASPPYLKAPVAAVERWRQRLADAAGLKVGLVWAGNPQHANDANRSLALGELTGLLAQPGVTWVSLQRDLKPGDAELLAQWPALRRYGEQLDDFGDTAALIANLDLVIGVDTSVVHLAGALGKPAWILLPKVPDWRWLLEREDTPWYPEARLFRQTQAKCWKAPLALLGESLAKHARRAAFGSRVGLPSASQAESKRAQLVALFDLLNQGRHPELESRARRLLQQFPDEPDLLKLLGVALEKQGRPEEALVPLTKADELRPEQFDLNEVLAYTLARANRSAPALERFRKLQAWKPDDWRYPMKVGECAAKLLQFEAALAAYARVCELKPDHATAFAERGRLLSEMRRYDEASEMQLRAIELDAKNRALLTNGGVMLTKAGRYAEGEALLRRSIAIEPSAAAYLNLGYTLKKMRRLGESLAATRQSIALAPEKLLGWRNLCFDLNYADDADDEERLAAALGYGKALMASVKPYERWKVQALPDKKLRVGLVSGDLGNHPVSFFLEGVLGELDASRVELFIYSNNRREDDQTARIRQHAREWRGGVVGLSDEKLARRIHDDAVDILIDLGGHTATSRLDVFGRRPAPVQVAWLGYFATTGLPTVDWIIADPQVLPPEEAGHFVEKPWRLPDIYYCFTPPAFDVDVQPLPALANGFITFGCFNNLTKVTDVVLRVWARVLLALPTSRLLFKGSQLKEPGNRAHILAVLGEAGVAAERILFEEGSPRREYLESYGRVDIALDPFPYPGGTTTVEGLWMGVPVVTLRGRRFIAHQGETIMTNAGLADWIAEEEDGYVALAVRRAKDVAGLAALRAGMRERVRQSPLFDARRFAGHLLAAWQGMWAQWCASEEGLAHRAGDKPSAADMQALADHFQAGDFAAMAATARRLLAVNPVAGELWKALGVALGAAGEDALPALKKAAGLIPDDADVWRNLSFAYRLAGQWREAADAARELTRCCPASADAWVTLGAAERQAGDMVAAEAAWNEAWRIDPGQLDAARALIELVPKGGRTRIAQGRALVDAFMAGSTRPADWLFAAHVLRYMADWDDAELLEAKVLAAIRDEAFAGTWPGPFQLVAVPGAGPLDQLRCARGFAAGFVKADRPPLVVGGLHAPDGKIRLGYLSNDFHAHATTYLINEVIERHDRQCFEVIAYDHSPESDSVYRRRMRAAFDRIEQVGNLDDATLAQQIAADGVDILIDLKGWTGGSRCAAMARRPAPVQVQWLGFPGTTGAPWVDYLVADPLLIREGDEAFYSEKIIFLPDTYQPNDRRRGIAPSPTRQSVGLPEVGLVLACFNQSYKLNRGVFAVWMRILQQVPECVLWLFDDNPVATQNLKARAEAAGIAPNRLVFGGRLPPDQHLGRLALADLALDCAPCGSHTTASDALWAGVPLLALAGDTFASRVSSSLLTAVELPELIADSLADYENKLLALCQAPGQLAGLRARLASRRLSAPLFDSARFVRHFEAGLAAAWQRHLAGLPVAHIRVAPIADLDVGNAAD